MGSKSNDLHMKRLERRTETEVMECSTLKTASSCYSISWRSLERRIKIAYIEDYRGHQAYRSLPCTYCTNKYNSCTAQQHVALSLTGLRFHRMLISTPLYQPSKSDSTIDRSSGEYPAFATKIWAVPTVHWIRSINVLPYSYR
jgi:hypothetical protein